MAKSKYNKEERLEIGRRIYFKEISQAMAAEEYGINVYTARDYLRMYKASQHIAEPNDDGGKPKRGRPKSETKSAKDYDGMTRDELVEALIKSEIDLMRAKKGYSGEGSGRRGSQTLRITL